MLSLTQLVAPPVTITLRNCTLRISPMTIRMWGAWEAWLRAEHVAAVERQTRDLPIDERATLVMAAREHAKAITTNSPEAAAALQQPAGQAAFVVLNLNRCHPQIEIDNIDKLVTPEEIRKLVASILELDVDFAPEVVGGGVADGPPDFAAVVFLLAREFGYRPCDVADLTLGQMFELIDCATGDGQPTQYKHRGRTMRRFRTRAEAEAFIASQREKGRK